MSTPNDEHWLEIVQESLSILREIYPEVAGTHGYHFGPKLSEQEIRAWEQILHIRLPDDYRDFLLHIGNGGLGPSGGLKSFAPGESMVQENTGYKARQAQRIKPRSRTPDPFEPEDESEPDDMPSDPEESFYAIHCPDYWIGPNDFAKPFLYTEALHEYDGFPREGVVELASDNGACVTVLVVSGEEYGHVWEISYGGVIPYEETQRTDNQLIWRPYRTKRYTFKDWYLDWLQAMCNTAEAAQISRIAERITGRQDWLGEVHQGLTELHELRLASDHRWSPIRFGTPPTDAELATREQELGIRLPEDYRDFLLHIGNGGFGPGYGLRYFEVEERDRTQKSTIYAIDVEFSPRERVKKEEISRSFPFTEPYSVDEILEWGLMDTYLWTGYIEVADHGCTSFEILIVAGAEYGHIWGMGDGDGSPYEICYAPRNDLLWEPLRPHRYTFKDWYLDWLQAMLNTARQRGIS